MLTGLIGKKLGMTQMTDAAGRVRAATVLTLGPCTVSQVKTADCGRRRVQGRRPG
jgi:large subunit ribosomal protein L3